MDHSFWDSLAIKMSHLVQEGVVLYHNGSSRAHCHGGRLAFHWVAMAGSQHTRALSNEPRMSIRLNIDLVIFDWLTFVLLEKSLSCSAHLPLSLSSAMPCAFEFAKRSTALWRNFNHSILCSPTH